ncbi:MAG TPA: hypothetical protein DIU28_01635 [Anabaena sp. UBA12330]|nr:hypothetical protein [Anabaena sp. UBA12330]
MNHETLVVRASCPLDIYLIIPGSSVITHYLSPITYYLLPITYYLLPITHYPLPITYYLFPA